MSRSTGSRRKRSAFGYLAERLRQRRRHHDRCVDVAMRQRHRCSIERQMDHRQALFTHTMRRQYLADRMPMRIVKRAHRHRFAAQAGNAVDRRTRTHDQQDRFGIEHRERPQIAQRLAGEAAETVIGLPQQIALNERGLALTGSDAVEIGRAGLRRPRLADQSGIAANPVGRTGRAARRVGDDIGHDPRGGEHRAAGGAGGNAQGNLDRRSGALLA